MPFIRAQEADTDSSSDGENDAMRRVGYPAQVVICFVDLYVKSNVSNSYSITKETLWYQQRVAERQKSPPKQTQRRHIAPPFAESQMVSLSHFHEPVPQLTDIALGLVRSTKHQDEAGGISRSM